MMYTQGCRKRGRLSVWEADLAPFLIQLLTNFPCLSISSLTFNAEV